ncbi:telomerase reverse transcriptase isoform X2 [Bombus impatiens]|nr:telomerase reverse transcriptase isoform X2 [Bombus impatiens]
MFPKENVYHNLQYMKKELTISLYNTSSCLPSYKSYTSLKECLFNKAETGKEIYQFIVERTMTNNIVADYEGSIPLVSPILEQFKKRHTKFHYFSVLKHLTQKQESSEVKSECEYQVNKKQLKLFFDLIFSKIIPLGLFGKLRNLKKIKLAMFHLLDTPCFKSFNLMPFIKKLDISSITWLQDIKTTRTQWYIIAKLVKWLFVGFLLKILYTYFHMTLASKNNERLYIMRSTWNSIQRKFIKKGKRSNTLQPDINCKGWKPPIGRYVLIPKNSDVRPIFKPEYVKPRYYTIDHKNPETNHLNLIFKFLKQLHTTIYGNTNFGNEWESIVQHKRNEGTTHLYFVSCDVTNAFGSIIQEELYNIIQTLCKDLPENLILKYYAVKSKKFVEEIVCYKQYFSDPNLLLPLAPGTLYSNTNMRWQQVKKKWLLEKISEVIFQQRVKINEEVHVITKGVVQGAITSSVLSDIYYNFILHKAMSTYLTTGKIIKYVDDILYVTESESVARQFLQLTKEGIPQYNCYFKPSKTRTNVVTCDGNITVDNITYIGYEINCTTLEVEYKHSHTNFSHTIKVSKKDDLPPLVYLRKRLSNIACLKLSKFILNRTINSENTIMRIIKRACLLQAEYTCILIKELFDNEPRNIQGILLVMQNIDKRIARHIIKTSLIGEIETIDKLSFNKWNRKILHILWMSYKTVFMKDKILQPKFIRYFSQRKRIQINKSHKL